MIDNAQTWKLLAFPPSNDCDLARWLLDRYGLAYAEEAHTVIFLGQKSKSVGGAGGFPTVYGGTTVLNNLDDLIGYFEPLAPAERKLLPADPTESAAAAALWKKFHEGIGFAAARYAYAALLPERSLMIAPLSRDCPWYEKAFVWVAYPLVAMLITRSLGITPDVTAQSLADMEKAFDDVDAMLADGRSFLVGNALSLTDLAFAAMAVPAVWPPEYQGALPPFEEIPSGLKAEITKLRARPAGQFALRLYREYRRKA